ncbi:MAG: enoyl-CoA hydratase/isomerase family protein [Actinomycetota bacterium]
MPEAAVLTRVEGGVGRIELDRPANGNAIDARLADDFAASVTKVIEDPTVRVIVLQSGGRVFCGGGDLAAVAAADDPSAYIGGIATAFSEGLALLAESGKLSIAAVQGVTAGAGLAIVLTADLVVASDRATFVGAYGAVGLTPDCGVSYFLPRVVGPRRAAELLLTRRVVDATVALDWALVNEVVPADALGDRVTELAESIVSGAVHAVEPTKRLLARAETSDYRSHLAAEADAIALAAKGDATRALIDGFVRDRAARKR